jgi:GH25 family lysozyme M1 (1,4-beta-N-acetylmuramidase)
VNPDARSAPASPLSEAGTPSVLRRFADNWRGARGIARGSYYFFTFTPRIAQAKNFIDAVPRPRGELPPAVDVEFAGNRKEQSFHHPDLDGHNDLFLALSTSALTR